MLKRYTYRAHPTLHQVPLLNQTFGNVRFVYNKYVENNLQQKKLIGYSQACRDLTTLKAQPELEWLNDTTSIALQQTLKDATQGVKNFFKNPKRVRPPRFKKRSHRQSFRIVGETSFKVTKLNAKWGSVRLPKMGGLKFRLDCDLPSTPSSVTVIREPSGAYFVSFVVETNPQPLTHVNQSIAIDLGLTHYGTTVTSTGAVGKIENPRYYRKSQAKLAKLQQDYTRTVKGSKNREKARIKIAKQSAKTRNQRKDFINKLVKVMVSENQTIITETLKIENMVKNHNLAKSIMDAGWGLFLTTLASKTAETGRTHIKTDPYYPSSKTCSKCGVINPNLTLDQRTWTCGCGVTLDRDVNACWNLLAVGSTERLNAHSQEIVTENYMLNPSGLSRNLTPSG